MYAPLDVCCEPEEVYAYLIPGEVLYDGRQLLPVAKVSNSLTIEIAGKSYSGITQAATALLNWKTPVSCGLALRFWHYRTNSNEIRPLLFRRNRMERRPKRIAPETTPVDIITIPTLNPGNIFLIRCPGLRAIDWRGRYYIQNLEADSAILSSSGTSCVLSAIEPHEFFYLGLPESISPVLASAGIKQVLMPIAKHGILERGVHNLWRQISALVLEKLALGEHVAIHSGVGYGRAGYVAAKLLIEQGLAPTEAITLVRKVAPYSIDSFLQEMDLSTLS